MTSVKKKIPSDQKARQAALDPHRSFVVQAPAGSGKTELLIRRVLVLLTTVDDPEQIVAITFTRKAAAELRQRILEALVLGGEAEPDPDDVFRHELWRLAHAARARDDARGWELLASPGRLGIQTIDSLCASLARRLPILSSLGGLTEVTDDPEALWREAARGTLAALESDSDSALVAALEALYTHLDGQWQRLEELLVVQLGRRDQWLRLVVPSDDEAAFRSILEGALGDVITSHLRALRDAAPSFVAETLPSLARAAAAVLCDAGASSEIASLAALSVLPGEGIDDVAAWRALATLLLTSSGALRKTVNRKLGFLPKTDAKGRALKFLAELDEAPRFVALLGEVADLPPPRYTEAQWQILGALRRVLIRAAAELRVVFAEHHVVDFIAVSQAALRALGPKDAPTDLALALDYRLAHILVDEYQDTSFTQLALLEGLTAGWEPGDGRTLFLVGDPMQSIYRFREAEVGLFLQARARGVGELALESLVLRENFRSREGVVSWVNDTFAEVLPKQDDIDKGAVSYSASSPFRSAASSRAVTVHPFVLPADKDEVDAEMAYEAEAQAIAELVGASLAAVSSPDEAPTIAILGRARTHLRPVAAALQAAGVVYQAVEVDPLATRPAVSDLLALTRALVHEGDRLAWLSVLRAPWCGLELSDLLLVAEAAKSQTLWARLNEPSVCEALSPRGQVAVRRMAKVLAPALAQRRRRSLRRWVEGTWYALGGPATVGAAGVADALAFFGLLEAAEEGGGLVAMGALEEAVAKLYAPPDLRADGQVQLMTMHKAKGLEFDVVILAGLGRKPRSDGPALLRAMERARPDGGTDLLLGPIAAALDGEDPIADHLRAIDKQKGKHESGRLLYVACTRAREELHLFGHLRARAKDGGRFPAKSSLLAHLWPAVAEAYEAAPVLADDPQAVAGEAAVPYPGQTLWRLDATWSPKPLPKLPERILSMVAPLPSTDSDESGAEDRLVTFDWATPLAAAVGTVVHRHLERFAHTGLGAWSPSRVADLEPAIRASLRMLGLSGETLDEGVSRVQEALLRVLGDSRAAWIFDPSHEDSQAELALRARLDGEVVTAIVDRSFVDGGVRWIIDYKTGTHEGGSLAHFLDAEQVRYRGQLERYGRIFALRGDEPIRLALYFPLLAAWRAWPYTRSPISAQTSDGASL